MSRFAADLHIHTALSPCASDDMTPPAIVAAAIDRGLAMIGICDHNTTRNTAAACEAAGADITILAGMELQTVEEVHVLGLFPDADAADAADREVRATLPEADEPYYRRFGQQLLMDAGGKVLGIEKKMLAAATPFGLSDTVALIRRHGGLAIASHVDRPSFSVISQLGFFPPEVRFDAVEVSRHAATKTHWRDVVPSALPVVTSSDSHFLEDVGVCRTTLEIHEPTFHELAMALTGTDGRRCYA